MACHQVKSKRELIRVVRAPDGRVYVDETGKAHGRGAYLCRDRTCWDRGIGQDDESKKGPVAHSLKVTLSATDRATLLDYAQYLPDSAPTNAGH